MIVSNSLSARHILAGKGTKVQKFFLEERLAWIDVLGCHPSNTRPQTVRWINEVCDTVKGDDRPVRLRLHDDVRPIIADHPMRVAALKLIRDGYRPVPQAKVLGRAASSYILLHYAGTGDHPRKVRVEADGEVRDTWESRISI